tara:strand:+ start:1969 stop:2370 length:402 start_codon:yes stop_codon:yes gene_type:complete
MDNGGEGVNSTWYLNLMRLFDMMTNEDIKRLNDDRGSLDLTLRIEELERENKKLKKRAEEAEGENTIIKGIGNNSPEMKKLQEENHELIKKCRHAGRMMIELNLKYEANVKEIDRLSEENSNLKVLLKGTNGN